MLQIIYLQKFKIVGEQTYRIGTYIYIGLQELHSTTLKERFIRDIIDIMILGALSGIQICVMVKLEKS